METHNKPTNDIANSMGEYIVKFTISEMIATIYHLSSSICIDRRSFLYIHALM